MNLIFWRQTRDLAPDNAKAVATTEETPFPVQLVDNEDADPTRVTIDMPYQPPMAGQTVTRLVKVPGIGTGAAYADGEAFGGLIQFHDVFRPEKCSGTIVQVFFLDLDDEGINKDVPIFIRPFTITTDNNAFAPSAIDLLGCRSVISISTWSNWNANQFGEASGANRWISGESPHLWTQIVTRGADNIAAGSEPWIGIVVIPD